MKIIFMGTPDFAESSLKAIYEAGHEILAVITNPDKPSGRGMKLTASPVKQYAIGLRPGTAHLLHRYGGKLNFRIVRKGHLFLPFRFVRSGSGRRRCGRCAPRGA